MVTHSIEGLAGSESPVADQLLEGFRTDPTRTADLGVEGAIVDAAFTLGYLREHGFEKAVDSLLLTDLDGLMRVFGEWRRQTPEGQEWGRWADEVRAIEVRRAQKKSRSGR